MANNTEQKTVLLDVQLNDKINETLNKIVELNKNLQTLKNAQKEYKNQLDKAEISQSEYNKQMALNSANIKTISNELTNYNGLLRDHFKSTELTAGSMNQLSARLSSIKRVYRDLSEEERDSDFGKTLQEQAKTINSQLLELEKSYGQFGRQVGNYELAAKSMRSELQTLQEALVQMKLNNQDQTKDYDDLLKKASEIQDRVADVRREIKEQASDTAYWDGLSKSITGVVSVMGIYNSTLALLGAENEELNKVMAKMQATITVITSVSQLQNLVQKESIVYSTAKKIADKLLVKTQQDLASATTKQTLAQQIQNATQKKGNIITKAITTAQILWNAAIKANPVMWLITAIAGLIAIVVKLTSVFSSSKKAMEEMNAIEEQWQQTTEKGAEKIQQAENKKQQALNKTSIEARKRILELKKNGATEEQIAEASYQNEIKKLDVTIQTTQELLKQYQLQRNELARLASAHKTQMERLDKDSDKYKEAQKKLQEYNASIKELNKNIEQGNNIIADAKLSKEEKKYEQEQKKRQKNTTSSTETATEKRYKKEKKAYENLNKLQEKNNELEASLLDDSLSSQIEHEDKVFNQRQENKRKQIELDRKYNKITQQEAQTQYTLLEKDEQIYNNNRQKKLDEYLQNQLASIQKDDKQQLQQLKQTNKQKIKEFEQALYAQAGLQKTLLAGNENGAVEISPEEQALQKQVLEMSMAMYQQEQQEEERINKESLQKRIEQQTELINQQYEGDLIKFSDNEKKKTEIEIQRLQQIIDYKKNTENQDTSQEEAQLSDLQAKQRKLQLDSDLLLSLNTNKQKYEAQKQYYENEIALATDNQEKRKQLEDELANLTTNYNQQRIDQFNQYSGQVSAIASGLNDLLTQKEEAQTQKYEEENEKQKEVLQQRLDAGLISQEQYDKQVASLDATLDKKKQQIAIKQAKREKAMKTFETIINTASAIMNAWATMKDPISAGILTAFIASTGALQLATIQSTPLPKAEKGGLIKGKRHSQGGTIIEAEDGEMIINRKSTQKYGALLEAINQNNLKPLGINLPNNDLQELQQTIKDLKVYVAVEDINRGQKNYAKVESKATF